MTLVNEFNLRIDDLTVRPVRVHPFCHTLQGLFQHNFVRIDRGAGDDRLAPFVLQVHFCDRDVELAAQTRHERLDAPAFVLERETGGHVQVEGEGGDHFNSR